MKKLFKKVISVLIMATMISVTGGISECEVFANNSVLVTLDPSNASPFNNGRFEGWGTSLCWWANRLGYSEALTNSSAQLFFSDEGLSLDIGRYNLGGGDDPTHNHIIRSDSIIPGYATGISGDSIIYDWTADQNQRNIVLAALKVNPDLHVEGFSNSPPYFMTNSGCTSGAVSASNNNLKSDQYDNFAKYIAEVSKHFKDEFGIKFSSYSPMNEPDTTYWGAYSEKQEGCRFSPGSSQSNMIIATRNALDKVGLNDVIVAGTDETSVDTTITSFDRLTTQAKAALGRIDTHTYGGSKREELKALALNADKTLWMSEVDNGGTAGTSAGNMAAGLNLANRILDDMNGMQPAAWVLWNIVDFHKDSNFYYTNASGDKVYSEANRTLNQNSGIWGVGMGNHDTQTIELTQKYYVFGQFTKYICPGDTIIASSNRTVAAYNKDNGSIKIVAVNTTADTQNYVFDLSNFTKTGDAVQIIRTSGAFNGGESWADLGTVSVLDKKFSYDLIPNSVTTFVIENNIDNIGYFTINGPKSVLLNSTAQYEAVSNDLSPVTWAVSNERIATIDQNGLLTPIKGGNVTVRATNASLNTTKSIQITILDISKISIPSSNVTGSTPWNNSSNTCTRVVDGSLSSFFDGVSNGYVTLDLGAEYKIGAIAYAPRSGYEYRMIDGLFYGSLDGVNWDKLYSVPSRPTANVLTYVYPSSFDAGVSNKYYKYIKYTIPSGNQSYGGSSESYNCNIAEIEVWSLENEDPDTNLRFSGLNVSLDGILAYQISGTDSINDERLYVGLYKEDGTLNFISTKAQGEFKLSQNGKYKIAVYLWDENYKPVYEKVQEELTY